MINTSRDQLEQLKAESRHIYREGAPINEMGDRINLNRQVLPQLGMPSRPASTQFAVDWAQLAQLPQPRFSGWSQLGATISAMLGQS